MIIIEEFKVFDESICYGYAIKAPRQGVSNDYPQHMFFFLWRNEKKSQTLSPNTPPLQVLCNRLLS